MEAQKEITGEPKDQSLVYAINDNGELTEHFNNADGAKKHIAEFDDEDQYLMSVVPMSENEFHALSAIQHFVTSESDRIQLQKAIDESDNRDFIHAQLAKVEGDSWVNEMYMGHVKFSLVHGGYVAGEDEFHSVDMLSFDEHCDKLRRDIDFIQDYDRALSNAGIKRIYTDEYHKLVSPNESDLTAQCSIELREKTMHSSLGGKK